MNKYQVNNYLLLLFDKYGTKQTTEITTTYTNAVSIGNSLTAQPPYADYVVLRILKNSKDRAYPWSDK